MRLVSWIWFWYIILGFLMGGGAVMIWQTLKNLSLKLVWYEWILLILCNIAFMFMGQTFIASFQEFEPQAAWLTIVFMGIPILIMAVLLYRSINKRYLKKQGS
ncbi:MULTISPECIES: hypothetical protein [unclassified Lentimicrobium]|mgnify:CR=1 FL=1|uniref:hypothetical protein n=1 Tax=unclassified Lentimicrobium TaxID=2677434 RepID=UPI00155385DF|nr:MULTISPECIES: hypothetical protein [unclassified Lentimicrobium]NPD47677.1 hypothetical protein [Lentimicrobium sp. S6]NPD86133.1 hypothetical protein [Lentimicrobium sp. L6]